MWFKKGKDTFEVPQKVSFLGWKVSRPKGEGHEHLRTDHLFSPIDRRFPIWQARPMAVSGRPGA
jgi:hypothetical protein